MTHSKYSPSSASRWLECPASLKYAASYDHNINIFTGSVAHYIAEQSLKNKTPAKDWLDIAFYCNDGNLSLTDNNSDLILYAHSEIIDGVQSYLDYVYSLELDSFEVEYLCKDSDFGFGTADIVGMKDEVLHIIDFKFGKYKVSAVENKQLMLYALWSGKKFLDCKLHIFQPRVEPSISVYEFNIHHMREFGNRVKKAYQNIQKFPNLENYSKSACRFCKGKKFCNTFKVNSNVK